MFERGVMTILVWGLLLEILTLLYFSSAPWRFEFAYTLVLLIFNLTALIIMIARLRRSYR